MELKNGKKINEIVAKYTDTTDNVQDLNTSPIPIEFNTENFNDAYITPSSGSIGYNRFTFGKDGYYLLAVEGLLSNSGAQTMISFFVNGSIVYGNLSPYVSGGTNPIPFFIQTTIQIVAGDYLEVIGEKYDNDPNYLRTNPIYGIACTQLVIKKL